MDNLKIWFYVILGVIYLLSRMRKKPSQEPTQVPDRQPERPQGRMETPVGGSPKSLTFEELLKEITEAKTQVPQPSPVQKPKQTKKVKQGEPVRKQTFLHPSLEETMKLEDTVVNFGRFKGFEDETERNLLEEYTKDFRDPEGFKKAFVMSEILKRRF